MTGIMPILNAQFSALKSEFDEKSGISVEVSNAAAFLQFLSKEIVCIADILLDTLTKPESASILLSPLLLRSILASLLNDEERLDLVLDRSFAKFSDEL